MQLDAILEVAIGLVMAWLLLSMATSQVQELIVEWLGYRSVFLENQLVKMLGDPKLVKTFYDHPLIKPLQSKSMFRKDRTPASIPNPVFAKAAVDVFLNAGKQGDEVAADAMNISNLRNSLNQSMIHFEQNNDYLAKTLKYFAPTISNDLHWVLDESKFVESKLASYRTNIETWFDTTMIQATAVYKRNSQTVALIIGFMIAFIFNVDSFHITNQLWRDPTTRQAIVAQAGNIDPTQPQSVQQIIDKMNQLSLPIGWNQTNMPGTIEQAVGKLVGFFISGMAAAQGAPFWFDILRNLTGVKKSESAQKAKTE